MNAPFRLIACAAGALVALAACDAKPAEKAAKPAESTAAANHGADPRNTPAAPAGAPGTSATSAPTAAPTEQLPKDLAEALRQQHQPELLLVHPMGPDDAGHRHGGESDAYRLCARRLDGVLAHAVPLWQGAGYDVLLTSDHGMGRDRMHGGADPSEREVPFVWMPHTGRPAAALAAQLALPLPVGSTGLRDFIRSHRQLAQAQGQAGGG